MFRVRGPHALTPNNKSEVPSPCLASAYSSGVSMKSVWSFSKTVFLKTLRFVAMTLVLALATAVSFA